MRKLAVVVAVVVVPVLVVPLLGLAGAAGVVLLGGRHLLEGQRDGGGSCVVDVGESTSLEAEDASGEATSLDAVQLSNAATVVAAGARAGAGREEQVIALMTAMQETRLRNLANPVVPESLERPNDGEGSDHDSVGLFQQRPSMGWGEVSELMDPARSAEIFYERLAGVEGWEVMPAGRAAQAVQRSAFPDAYDRWEPVARTLVSALAGAGCDEAGGSPGGRPVAGVEGARAAVVGFASAQVGKPYVWGAAGPGSWDCSGLTMMAYREAGLSLPHSSAEQRHAGTEVSAAEALPGDLLWWPGHVAVYTGSGRMVGAQSPGEGVREMEVYGSPVYIRPTGLK